MNAKKHYRLLEVIFRLFTLLFVIALGVSAEAQVVINEFVAENAASAMDEDGANPDWIELLNTTAAEVNLEGWWLSDDPAVPMKWRFPAVTLAGRGYLVVFASGKNRTNPAVTLHTNFQLNNAGESVLLTRPDGAVVSQFLNYPPQREDVSYGTARTVIAGNLVQQGSVTRALVPANDTLGATWTAAAFGDGGWQSGTAGAGYDLGSNNTSGLLFFYNFNDTSPTQATDSSGNARHGVIENGAALTGDALGRTGLPGDRAMNFPNTAGNRVRVAAAATGGLDAITASNQVTVSVWMYGDASQPQPDSLFYGDDTTTGAGTRQLNAHAPYSDSTFYWDTAGCCGSGNRLSVAVPDSAKWRGQWNHYIFIKNGSTKQIWQNGALLSEGTNTAAFGLIRSFFIGSAPQGGYGGKVDDFAVWSRALTPEEIAQLAAGASPLGPFSFTSLIGTPLGAMRNVNASAYLRFPFTVSGPPAGDALQLRVKFDDGFVAYLNGIEIVRRNAPATVQWNSTATSDRSRNAALAWESLEISGGASQLVPGANVLAIQALNETVASTELLVLPELANVLTTPGRYMLAPTPGTPNSAGTEGFVADTQFSVTRGWFNAAFPTTITCATPGATLVYTLDGTVPTLANGTPVNPQDASTAPAVTLTISGTTTLRAAAFKTGHASSGADTETYLFAAQVAAQPATIPGWPATWPTGHPGDYQMDPDVTTTTLPGYGISDALLSLPTISVVGKLGDIVALYGASVFTGSQQAPELPAVAVSAEWIDPAAPLTDWQEDCALNIHGNISRSKDFTPKHGFSLNFSAQYGARSLHQDVFPGSGVTSFDQLVLKSLSTDSWPCSETYANTTIDGDKRWKRAEATYLRDELFRATQLAVSGHAARGRYAHLFLNGVYWGLINVTEHLDNKFAAGHFGGARDDWDVIKDYNELADGERTAWDQLLALAGTSGFSSEATYQQAQGRNQDGTRNVAYPVLLDVPNLIDYMIVHIAQGADDWPDKNWYGMRRRTDPETGFKFLAWDQEISNNSILKQHSANGPLYELVSQAGRPAQLYASARGNAGFQRQFGDRVQQLFFNGGPLTQSAMAARWHGLQSLVDKAVVAESARWGDYQRAVPYKREVEWLAASGWMDSTYWPQFVSRALIRFRNAGVYPGFDAPAFSQHGGAIPPGFTLAITQPNGAGFAIYYTTNGADPGAAGAPLYTAPIPLAALTTVRTRAKKIATGEWSAMTVATFQPEQNFAALAVTEICYDPPGAGAVTGDQFEFLELKNTGVTTLNLSACAFTAGIGFTFPDGTVLAPGAFVVIARNPAQLATRHPGIGALGPYTGKLDNSGEQLTLASALGTTILSFSYGVAPGWPAMNGGSLHYLSGPPENAASWFAFAPSPGAHADDADADGFSNLAEQIAGTDPGNPASFFHIDRVTRLADGSVQILFTAQPGRTYTVQVRDSLTAGTWQRLADVPAPAIPALTTIADPAASALPLRYYRIVVPQVP